MPREENVLQLYIDRTRSGKKNKWGLILIGGRATLTHTSPSRLLQDTCNQKIIS